MKVIFLDIDGVLNCDTTTETCAGYMGISCENRYAYRFDFQRRKADTFNFE